jgi:hypothetical protein
MHSEHDESAMIGLSFDTEMHDGNVGKEKMLCSICATSVDQARSSIYLYS